MRIILVMVSSADGKTTHPTVHGWSSPEDQEYFRKLKTEHPVIIMGRKTYESVRSDLILSHKTLRIVMTKDPDAFISSYRPNELEFTDEAPQELITRLARAGHKSALLVGGSNLNEAFLRNRLITDCYITIEPRFFGEGKSIFTSEAVDIRLALTETKKLNERGTLLLHYNIVYDH